MLSDFMELNAQSNLLITGKAGWSGHFTRSTVNPAPIQVLEASTLQTMGHRNPISRQTRFLNLLLIVLVPGIRHQSRGRCVVWKLQGILPNDRVREGTLSNEEPLSGIVHIAPDTDPSPSTSSHAILQSTSKENSYAPKLIAPIPPAWPLLPVLVLRPLKRGVTATSCLVSNYKRNIEARYPRFTAHADRISELTVLVMAVLTRWVVWTVWRLLRVLYRTVNRSLDFAVASFFWLIRF